AYPASSAANQINARSRIKPRFSMLVIPFANCKTHARLLKPGPNANGCRRLALDQKHAVKKPQRPLADSQVRSAPGRPDRQLENLPPGGSPSVSAEQLIGSIRLER